MGFTSGTFAFAPSTGEFVLDAFRRCGKPPASLAPDDFASARMSVNLVLDTWANKGLNLWCVDLQTIALTAGTPTYPIPPETIAMLDTYIRITGTDGTPQDRIILPLSRSDYASQPNKTQTGFPSGFWFDRTNTPTVTLWAVPDDTQAYTLAYYRFRSVQDANLANGENPEISRRFFMAFVADLAADLAIKHAPERAVALAGVAKERWTEAAEEDRERVPLRIMPGLSGYYRR